MFVSIIMPCLNESAYIEPAVRSIAASAAAFPHEIIVVDGGSTDDTVAKLRALETEVANLKTIHNPGRLQSAGMNIGAQASDPAATILLRADCHSIYPPDFVARCVDALGSAEAESVVVPMLAVGDSPLQNAIAAAQNSMMGNGGSAHRRGGTSGFVDHGHHAAFRKDFFLKVGGYEPTFSHNEDAELDFRIVRAGGRIWMNTDATIMYRPRRTLATLARQYYRFGAGRARTVVTHRMPLKVRQMLPVLVAFALFTSLVAGIAFPLLLAVPLGYAASLVAFAAMEAFKTRNAAMLLTAPALAVIQLGWAVGFARGFGRYWWTARRSISPTVPLVVPPRVSEPSM